MNDKIFANAELVRDIAQQHLGLDIKYDENGVRWLDNYINGQRDGASEETKKRLPNTLGCFLGECIRHSFGGAWTQDPRFGWAVEINQAITVFPFAKVEKQLQNPEGDSVLGLYHSIQAIIQNPDNSSLHGNNIAAEKRPWWKFWHSDH